MCICVSVCLSVWLSVCVFTFEVPIKRLFAPTSQSRTCKIFRDLDSLKSNGKKWSQIWKLLIIKGLQLPRKRNLVFGQILPYWAGFFLVSVFLTPFNGLLAPTSQTPMSKLFRFSKSLGKNKVKKWSQIGKHLLIKGVKLPWQKKVVCWFFFFIFALHLNGFFAPTSQSPMSKLFFNFWKSNRKSGLRFRKLFNYIFFF